MPLAKLLASAALGLAALALPAGAAAFPGEPDWDYGMGAKVTTPVPLGVPWAQAKVQLAATPDGGSVVAEGFTVVRYRSDGSLDSAFGEGGIRKAALPGFEFEVSDLAVDGEGRVLVTGTATPVGGTRTPRSVAAVVRYLPDGSPDPAFGDGGGFVLGRFGLDSSQVIASFGMAGALGSTTLVVSKAAQEPSCHDSARSGNSVVVRLSPDGSRDPSFGEGGVTGVGPLERVAGMASTRGGGVILAGPLSRRCGHPPETGVIALGADGTLERSFGDSGLQRLTGSLAAIEVDHSGRAVLLFKEKQLPARDEHAYKVAGLHPDGELDPDFSGGWLVFTAKGPSYHWTDLAIDSRERPLLIGTLVKELPAKGGERRFHRWFMVVPLAPSGRERDEFGYRGWIAITRFDPRSDAAASEAVLEGDKRILVAGTVRRPGLAPHGGIGLIRLGL
jgi:uncharacterized delta-60 repeat protein